jgi:hypothetical protein
MLVLQSLSGGNVAISADGLWRNAECHCLRLEEGELGKFHAQMIFGTVANPGLGVDGAIQMIVEIGALGHGDEKGAQIKRIYARCFERA